MLQSERIELAIYRYIKPVGTLRSTTIGELAGAVRESSGDVAERLRYLCSERHVNLWKYAGPKRLPYSEDGNVLFGPREFLHTGSFEIELSPSGRKYFEMLEAREGAECEQPATPGAAVQESTPSVSPREPSVLVLISHSSRDIPLASEVTEFLRAGLALRAEEIRCSSVDGYRLPGGVNTEAQLRREVSSAKVLIGLITANSLSSPYVLFELGARWGAGLPTIPLLAGVKAEEMRGPLTLLNALSCSSEGQLHQVLSDMSKLLDMPVQNTASYLRYLNAVRHQADAVSTVSVASAPIQGKMVFEESVYWKRADGERDGPYCPNCYEDKKKEIHLTRGATKGMFLCGLCGNSFTTAEYDARPVRRRPYGRH